MRSGFYYEGHHRAVALAVRDYINASRDFLSPLTAGSPRAAGDAIEALVAEEFENILGDWCTQYSSEFTRRAMADMAFKDQEGFCSLVDVKTHREGVSFSMPNLTSVRRLARFYECDTNVFSLLLIKYAVEGTRVSVSDVVFCPIEFLDWSCLTVGALGWGQIQIANANNIRVNDRYSRKQWMLHLCDAMLEFYPKEIAKIRDRVERFNGVRESWEAKEDLWH